IQLAGCLLINQTDTGKAVIASPSAVKDTAPGAHALQQLILLKEKQAFLKPFQIPLNINVVNLWKNLLHIRIVLPKPVMIARLPLPIRHKGESQDTVLPGGKLPGKILPPDRKTPVGADPALPVQAFQ